MAAPRTNVEKLALFTDRLIVPENIPADQQPSTGDTVMQFTGSVLAATLITGGAVALEAGSASAAPATVMNAPNILPAQRTAQHDDKVGDRATEHRVVTVHKGDTKYRFAVRNHRAMGVSEPKALEEIEAVNPQPDDDLQVGSKFIIPDEAPEHEKLVPEIVKAGDTYIGIAKAVSAKTGVPKKQELKAIERVNTESATDLQIGSRLLIPEGPTPHAHTSHHKGTHFIVETGETESGILIDHNVAPTEHNEEVVAEVSGFQDADHIFPDEHGIIPASLHPHVSRVATPGHHQHHQHHAKTSHHVQPKPVVPPSPAEQREIRADVDQSSEHIKKLAVKVRAAGAAGEAEAPAVPAPVADPVKQAVEIYLQRTTQKNSIYTPEAKSLADLAKAGLQNPETLSDVANQLPEPGEVGDAFTKQATDGLNSLLDQENATMPDDQVHAMGHLLGVMTEIAQSPQSHAVSVARIANGETPTPEAGQPEHNTPKPEQHHISGGRFENGMYQLSQEQQATIANLNLSDAQKKFLTQAIEGVMSSIHNGARINPIVAVAQAIDESGWGDSGLASEYNNLFGMKPGDGYNGKVTPPLATTEYYNGQRQTIMARFRAYDDFAGSFEDYGSFIASEPWYGDASAHYTNPSTYLDGLENKLDSNGHIIIREGEPGSDSYATSPTYKQTILHIADSVSLPELLPNYSGQQDQPHEDSPAPIKGVEHMSSQEKGELLVKVGLSLAWKTVGHGPLEQDATPAYQAAEQKYNGSEGTDPYSDCGVFMATIVHESGIDPNYPARGTAAQIAYLEHSDKWQGFDKINDVHGGRLLPGDIMIFSNGGEGHTYMYTGREPNAYDAISASLFGHVPEPTSVYMSQGNNYFKVFRPK